MMTISPTSGCSARHAAELRRQRARPRRPPRAPPMIAEVAAVVTARASAARDAAAPASRPSSSIVLPRSSAPCSMRSTTSGRSAAGVVADLDGRFEQRQRLGEPAAGAVMDLEDRIPGGHPRARRARRPRCRRPDRSTSSSRSRPGAERDRGAADASARSADDVRRRAARRRSCAIGRGRQPRVVVDRRAGSPPWCAMISRNFSSAGAGRERRRGRALRLRARRRLDAAPAPASAPRASTDSASRSAGPRPFSVSIDSMISSALPTVAAERRIHRASSAPRCARRPARRSRRATRPARARRLRRLHERAVAGLHVEHQAADPFGDLLAHDRRAR